jgi:hypothetical protein
MLIALLVAGCGTAPAPQRVAEVVPRIHALNGKVVRVAGYLGACGGYECRLFVDEAGWHEFGRAVEKLMRTREAVRWPTHLGIGSGEKFDFDRKAEPFNNSYVVVTGRINDKCRTPSGEPGCTDRGTDLEPTDIRPWFSPGTPAKS